MKSLFSWIPTIFWLSPGVAGLAAHLGIPPGKKMLYLFFVEAIGGIALLLLYLWRGNIRRWSKENTTKLSVGLCLLFILSFCLYLILSGLCVVRATKPQYQDFGYVFFPLWLDSPIREAVDDAGSREAVLDMYGPRKVEEELRRMAGSGIGSICTDIILIFVFSVVLCSVVIVSAIIGYRVTNEEDIQKEKEASGQNSLPSQQ